MTLVIPVAMIAVLALLLLKPNCGLKQVASSGDERWICGDGDFGSLRRVSQRRLCDPGDGGGNVVLFATRSRALMAMSKTLNTVSSLIAAAVFAWYRTIDWRLGIILSVASFIGGFVISLARKMPAKLLRQLFLLAVAALAVKR